MTTTTLCDEPAVAEPGSTDCRCGAPLYPTPGSVTALVAVRQGRVTYEPANTRAGVIGRWHIDDQPASTGTGLTLGELHRLGYIEHSDLLVGDEWARAWTTDLGNHTLAFFGEPWQNYVQMTPEAARALVAGVFPTP